MASLSTNSTINSNQLSPASFTVNIYAVTLEYLISVKLDQNNYVIRKFSNAELLEAFLLLSIVLCLNLVLCELRKSINNFNQSPKKRLLLKLPSQDISHIYKHK